MVIMTVVDGEERIYRNVHSGLYLNYVNGFLLMRNYARQGEMYQLRGKEKRLLHKFGRIELNVNN